MPTPFSVTFAVRTRASLPALRLDEINPKKWPSEFTTELLELLWVLEATFAEYPAQAKLLSAVVKGSCFHADELPEVPDAARKPPSRPSAKGLFDKAEDENE
ncbi:MAG: hypothetical protein SVV80_12205 [Planctomycetota bacterium]|nr:hypothetical protein [Planctomycetota bacterium]